MPIRVLCPSCHTRVNSPETTAGKTFRCPKCAASVAVPEQCAGAVAAAERVPPARSDATTAVTNSEGIKHVGGVTLPTARSVNETNSPTSKKRLYIGLGIAGGVAALLLVALIACVGVVGVIGITGQAARQRQEQQQLAQHEAAGNAPAKQPTDQAKGGKGKVMTPGEMDKLINPPGKVWTPEELNKLYKKQNSNPPGTPTVSKVTRENYNHVQVNHTRAFVESVLGPGREVSSDGTTVRMMWENRNPRLTIYVTFEHDWVTHKSILD